MNAQTLPDSETIREHVRERHGAIAQQGDESCGCTATGCCGGGDNYGEKLGYPAAELAAAAGADLGLGCGNPFAIAGLRPGGTVLDLGSGAGFDCVLAARQLAGTGRVIGVDMTPAMVTKARALQTGGVAKGGLANIEFRLGEIEALPVDEFRVMLAEAGFFRVAVETRESTRALIGQRTRDPTAGEFVVSALITAYKP